MNMLRTMFKGYLHILNNYPVFTQAIQSGALMGAGDLIAQTLIEKKSLANVDTLRIARFAGIGFFLVGPVLRKWYVFMDQRIGQKGGVTVIKKVAVDQLLFAPIFLGTLLTTIGVVAGSSFTQIKEQTLGNYPDVLMTNYKVWPLVQLFNFYLIPLSYQVLVAQIVAVFWNTYLSWKANKPLEGGTFEIKEAVPIKQLAIE